jgi:hypothetical protein
MLICMTQREGLGPDKIVGFINFPHRRNLDNGKLSTTDQAGAQR